MAICGIFLTRLEDCTGMKLEWEEKSFPASMSKKLKQARTSGESLRTSALKTGSQPLNVFERYLSHESSDDTDFVSVIRAIDGFVSVPEDRNLEFELRNKLHNKMVTLDNMANSEFHLRKRAPTKPSCSTELISMSKATELGLYKYSGSLKYADFADLNSMWNQYAVAFLALLQSASSSECPEGRSIIEFKHSLIISHLELLGALLEVVDSPNKSNVGLSGFIIQENANSLSIITAKNKLKLIPKNVCSMKLLIPEHAGVVLFGPDMSGTGRSGSMFRESDTVVRRRQIHELAYK
jgi:RNase P/RNase MRP subunit p29